MKIWMMMAVSLLVAVAAVTASATWGGPLRAAAAAAPSLGAEPDQPRDRVISRIAFGSCLKQDRPQPIWDAVLAAAPDLFVFLGDNVYADTRDIQAMARTYDQLAADPGFQALRASCPLLATWDDHDYGENDAGAEYPMRRESQKVFTDFWNGSADSPRRTRDGVHDSAVFGPEGRRIQIILLDTRSFRSPLTRRADEPPRAYGSPGPYAPTTDPAATLLGADQWAWLAEQLKVPAEIRIIASSIQVVADEHWFEKWGNFPHERSRLIDLIADTGARGVIFLTGDRHHAEISRLDSPQAPYPLYDITASGLNQSKRWSNELNTNRVGAVYLEPHFGLLEIDWSRPDPLLSLQIRAEDGKPLILHDIPLSMLR